VSTKLIREGDFSPARINTILLGDAERLANARLAPLVAALERWERTPLLPDNFNAWDACAMTVLAEYRKLKEGK
jgi:hypothetical protein